MELISWPMIRDVLDHYKAKGDPETSAFFLEALTECGVIADEGIYIRGARERVANA